MGHAAAPSAFEPVALGIFFWGGERKKHRSLIVAIDLAEGPPWRGRETGSERQLGGLVTEGVS